MPGCVTKREKLVAEQLIKERQNKGIATQKTSKR
jgi:DNA phosphorothioation-dependent restriction protein DptG